LSLVAAFIRFDDRIGPRLTVEGKLYMGVHT
jgi:hypothetical protein